MQYMQLIASFKIPSILGISVHCQIPRSSPGSRPNALSRIQKCLDNGEPLLGLDQTPRPSPKKTWQLATQPRFSMCFQTLKTLVFGGMVPFISIYVVAKAVTLSCSE